MIVWDGGGPVSMLLAPRCPEHGEMKPRKGDTGNGYAGTVWACPGWDGEGCDYRAAPQWREIGWTDGPVRIWLE